MKFRVYFHDLFVQNGIMADTIRNPVRFEGVKQLYVRRLGFKDVRMLSSFLSSRVLTSTYTVSISKGAKYGYTHDF